MTISLYTLILLHCELAPVIDWRPVQGCCLSTIMSVVVDSSLPAAPKDKRYTSEKVKMKSRSPTVTEFSLSQIRPKQLGNMSENIQGRFTVSLSVFSLYQLSRIAFWQKPITALCGSLKYRCIYRAEFQIQLIRATPLYCSHTSDPGLVPSSAASWSTCNDKAIKFKKKKKQIANVLWRLNMKIHNLSHQQRAACFHYDYTLKYTATKNHTKYLSSCALEREEIISESINLLESSSSSYSPLQKTSLLNWQKTQYPSIILSCISSGHIHYLPHRCTVMPVINEMHFYFERQKGGDKRRCRKLYLG